MTRSLDLSMKVKTLPSKMETNELETRQPYRGISICDPEERLKSHCKPTNIVLSKQKCWQFGRMSVGSPYQRLQTPWVSRSTVLNVLRGPAYRIGLTTRTRPHTEKRSNANWWKGSKDQWGLQYTVGFRHRKNKIFCAVGHTLDRLPCYHGSGRIPTSWYEVSLYLHSKKSKRKMKMTWGIVRFPMVRRNGLKNIPISWPIWFEITIAQRYNTDEGDSITFQRTCYQVFTRNFISWLESRICLFTGEFLNENHWIKDYSSIEDGNLFCFLGEQGKTISSFKIWQTFLDVTMVRSLVSHSEAIHLQ